MISTRILDWISKLPMADNIRVRDDGYEPGRHDSTWISDFYIHARVGLFVRELSRGLASVKGSLKSSGKWVFYLCTSILMYTL